MQILLSSLNTSVCQGNWICDGWFGVFIGWLDVSMLCFHCIQFEVIVCLTFQPHPLLIYT